MNYNRRSFIKTAGGLSAVFLLGNQVSAYASAEKARPFGLQLYSVKEALAKNPKGAILDVLKMGYKEIETFEGGQGIYWGMSHKEYLKLLQDHDATPLSAHCDINKDFEKKAEQAAEIGMRYLMCPWIGPQITLDNYKRYAQIFNEKGKICADHGIRFAYHNHDYSFKQVEGAYPQDILIKETDPELVDFEMDIYWVITAGQDPVKWLQANPERFKLCHVKDGIQASATGLKESTTVTLGKGTINFEKVLTVAKKYGVQHYIVEQENFEGTTPMEAAADNVKYMKKLQF